MDTQVSAAEVSAQAIEALRQQVEIEEQAWAAVTAQRERAVNEERQRLEAVQSEYQHGLWLEALGADLLSGLNARFTPRGMVLLYRGCTREFISQNHFHHGTAAVLQAILTWIKDVDDGYAAQEEDRQAQQAGIQRIVAALNRVQSDEDFRTIEIPWDLEGRVEIAEAEEQAQVRARAAREEREARRLELQKAAFYPFVFYRVHYGILAMDDEGRYVEREYVDSLTAECDHQGWWYPVSGGHPVRVANVYQVERIEVCEHTEMPGWCARHEVEFGKIQVPPADVERL